MLSKVLRFLTLIFVPIVAIVLLKGCAVNRDAQLTPFKIGLNTWPGYQVALYAKEAGLFRKHGLDVEFVRFTNQQDNIRATMRGSQDASFVPLAEVMQVDPTEEQPVYVLVVDISAGSDGIAAGPQIRSVKDLKGKKASAKFSTISHLILLEALQAAQLKPQDVEIVDVANERGVELLKKAKIDASVLWEPLLNDAAKAVKGKVIYTTADVDSVVIDGVATRSSVVANQQDTLVRFIQSWFEVMQAVNTKPQEVFASVAQQLNTTPEIFAKDYQGLKKGDVAMNQRMFQGGRLQAAAQQTYQLLTTDPRHGRIVRQDVQIDATSVTKATNNWQP